MAQIKRIPFKNFVWINVSRPKEQDMEKLRQEFDFHPLHIQECLKPSHRTKIDINQNSIFFVMLFPLYERTTRSIQYGEMHFFISQKYLITVGDSEFKSFENLVKLFEHTKNLRAKFSDGSPERLLYEILNQLFAHCFPMIDHLIIDCDKIQEQVFQERQKRMISEILIIRRNITDFRKIMQVHKNVLKKLIFNLRENKLYVMKKTDVYYESLIDSAKEIWDTLENLKERIEALQDSNESQISFTLSDVMKTLTIISVLTFPLTMVAAIFAIDLPGRPFLNQPSGFWIVLSGMFGILIIMLFIFRKKRWF